VDSRKLRDLRSGMCAYTQFFCECAAADDRAAYDRRRPRSPPAATVRPERTSGIEVSVYPNTNASPIASATVARLLNPRAVPSAIPVISPAAHPIRQFSVAVTAKRLSDGSAGTG